MGWVPWGVMPARQSCGSPIPMPDSMSWTDGAAFPICYGTAYGAFSIGRVALKRGEAAMVHGAAGGVGLAAVDVAKARAPPSWPRAARHTSWRPVSSKAPTRTINYREESVRDAVKAAVGGVDVVLDPVGGDVFDQSLRCAIEMDADCDRICCGHHQQIPRTICC